MGLDAYSCGRHPPGPASSPVGRCAPCSKRWACRTSWRNRSARRTRTTWCGQPSTRSSAKTPRARSPRGAISKYRPCRRGDAISERVSRPPTEGRTRREADMNTTAKVLKIEQIGSAIRRHKTQRETLIGLGLNRIGRVVELPDTPQTRGMIAKVRHLIRVVEAEGEQR